MGKVQEAVTSYEIISCPHLNDEKNFRRGPDSIKLTGNVVLTLCEDCMALVRGRVMEEIMGSALKEVFQATVEKELR